MATPVAIVTGSTGGIGLGIARALAARGYHLQLHGIYNDGFSVGDGEKLVRSFSDEFKINVALSNQDLTNPENAGALVREAFARFGHLDVLVNNAGMQFVSSVQDFPFAKWQQILNVNLSAAFCAIQEFLRLRDAKTPGRIVNIASAHGWVASAQKSAYVASKHGLLGLTKAVALEQATGKVTCNAVCPGWVRTPLVEAQLKATAEREGIDSEEAALKFLKEKHPSLRFTTPEQLGESVLFICSDAASNMTGSSLVMDGGWTAINLIPTNPDKITAAQLESLMEAARAAPSESHLQFKVANMLRDLLPSWHLPMINDTVRNRYYADMIKREVRDKTVLEIGAGTGYLALQAAEAGARHIYACESNPLFFNLAKANIEKSPWRDRITLFSMTSQKLRLKKHLPAKVDLIISEIISTDIFSENLLWAHRDARRLLKKGGRFLPERIEARACLIDIKKSKLEPNAKLAVADELKRIIDAQPRRMNLLQREFRRVSETVALATVTDGDVVEPRFPIEFRLRRTKAAGKPSPEYRTLLCLYFWCGDDGAGFTTFPESSSRPDLKMWAHSWGQKLWPLEPASSYQLKMHLVSDSYPVLTVE